MISCTFHFAHVHKSYKLQSHCWLLRNISIAPNFLFTLSSASYKCIRKHMAKLKISGYEIAFPCFDQDGMLLGLFVNCHQSHTTRSFQCKADKITLAMLKLKHYYNIFEKQNIIFSIFEIRLWLQIKSNSIKCQLYTFNNFYSIFFFHSCLWEAFLNFVTNACILRTKNWTKTIWQQWPIGSNSTTKASKTMGI